jgi:hypothetical protein
VLRLLRWCLATTLHRSGDREHKRRRACSCMPKRRCHSQIAVMSINSPQRAAHLDDNATSTSIRHEGACPTWLLSYSATQLLSYSATQLLGKFRHRGDLRALHGCREHALRNYEAESEPKKRRIRLEKPRSSSSETSPLGLTSTTRKPSRTSKPKQ